MTAPVRQRPALALGLALAVGGCGHSARTGPPASLPTGEPRNACEQRAWLETAPARFRPGGTSAIFEGIGVFRANESELQDLDAVFPRMKEAELQAGHQERVARTDAATRRALIWGAIAGGGMVAGLGTAALIEDRNHAAANVFGISGLAIGVVGVIGMLLTMPSMQDSVDAEARHKLFVEGEDDLGAVNRGIDRANQAARHGCAAQPARP